MCRLLGLLGIWFFVLTALTPLPNLLNHLARVSPQLVPSDAIVVPGGSGVLANGALTTTSAARAEHGIALYRSGLAPLLVFLGTARDDGGPTEAEARAEIARQRGIPVAGILTDAQGLTTKQEAVRTKALLQPKGVRTILLVTDSLHLARARPVFQHAGFEVHAAPTDDLAEPAETPEERLALMRGIAVQASAWLLYRVAGYW